MSTHSLYQHPPKSSIVVFTFFQNPGQMLVKKSPFCPGFQAIGPGLPGRKTAAPKGRPHGKPSVAFGPHSPLLRWPALEKGRPACVRPPCAGTNGAKCALCPWGGRFAAAAQKQRHAYPPAIPMPGGPSFCPPVGLPSAARQGPGGAGHEIPLAAHCPAGGHSGRGRERLLGGWNAQPGRGCRSFWG